MSKTKAQLADEKQFLICDATIPHRQPNGGKQCWRLGRYDGRCSYHRKNKTKTRGCIDGWGYRVVYIQGKRIREHRYIMEQMLGRSLQPIEHVHHKNGIRTDNRPENLQLLTLVEHSTLTCKEFGLIPPLVTKTGLIHRQSEKRQNTCRCHK